MQRQDFADLFRDHDRPAGHDPAARSAAARVPAEDRRGDRGSRQGPGGGADKLRRRAAELHEFNPMLGFRGIRLAVRYPEIAEMQARAIFEGAVEANDF